MLTGDLGRKSGPSALWNYDFDRLVRRQKHLGFVVEKDPTLQDQFVLGTRDVQFQWFLRERVRAKGDITFRMLRDITVC